MTLEDLLSQLRVISAPFKEHKNHYEALGFQPFLELEDQKKLLRKGWWHTLWIGYSHAGDFYVGLRILPERNWNEWPVVIINDLRRAVLHAPSLSSAAALFVFNAANSSPRVFSDIKDKIQQIENIALPFYKALGSEGDLCALREHVENAENRPLKSIDDVGRRGDRFTAFMSRLGGSEGLKVFYQTLEKMMAEREYIPAWPSVDLGAWESRLANVIAARSVICEWKLSSKQLGSMLWRGFVQPHGYDAGDISICYYPENSYEPYMGIWEIVLILTASDLVFEKSIMQHPLFTAVEAMRGKGASKYVGVEHVEAAALLDEVLQEPVVAWNSLVSAAYWSGKNLSEAMMPAWDAAICLSEKQGWKDASTALKIQKALYDGG